MPNTDVSANQNELITAYKKNMHVPNAQVTSQLQEGLLCMGQSLTPITSSIQIIGFKKVNSVFW